MARYSDVLTNDDFPGVPVSGISVTVIASNGALATLTADNGATINQPFIAGPILTFNIPDPGDEVTIQYRYGGRLLREDDQIVGVPPIFKGDPGAGPGGSVGPFASLSTAVIPAGINSANVDDGGRIFEDTTMTDADVAAYPLGITKTANGRYFRRDLQGLNALQFKAVNDARLADGTLNPNPTDNIAAFRAMYAYSCRFPVNKNGPTLQGVAPIHIPLGSYYCSDTWEIKGGTVRIQGDGQGKDGPRVTELLFASGKHGIIVQRADTVGVDGPSHQPYGIGADGTIIDGIAVDSLGGASSNVPVNGIVLRARATVTNTMGSYWSGVGCLVIATAGSATNQGNANSSKVETCAFTDNGQLGLLAIGSDANACKFDDLDLSRNGRGGYKDLSDLGNHCEHMHVAACGVAGYGGNTANASSVKWDAGAAYFVLPGQGANAPTSKPSTSPTVWALHPVQPSSQPTGFPTWVSGDPAFEAAPYAFLGTASVSSWGFNYAEGSQPPVQIQGGAKVGGIQSLFFECGIITVGNGGYMHITSRFGAADNPGGFSTEMTASQSVTTGFNGHFHEYTDSAIPMGIQLQPTATGMAWTLAGGASLAGFNATNTSGARFEVGVPLYLPGGGQIGGFATAIPTYTPTVPTIVFNSGTGTNTGWKNPGNSTTWTAF